MSEKLKHLIRVSTSISESFTSPRSAPRPKPKEQNRAIHAQSLIEEYSNIKREIGKIEDKREALGIAAPEGR